MASNTETASLVTHPEDGESIGGGREIDLANRSLASAESIIQDMMSLRNDPEKQNTISVLYDSQRDGDLMAQIEGGRVVEIEGCEWAARIIELKMTAAFQGEEVTPVEVFDKETNRKTTSIIFGGGFTVSVHRQYEPGQQQTELRSIQVEAGYIQDLAQSA